MFTAGYEYAHALLMENLKVAIYDLDENYITTASNLSEAATYVNGHSRGIMSSIRNGTDYLGYLFEYV